MSSPPSSRKARRLSTVFRRPLCLAVLLCVLPACGGERPADDAARGAQAIEASPADSGAATTSSGPGESHIPAFVGDSASESDSTGSADTIRSIYTSLGEADCRLVERDEDTREPTYRCPGTAGFALLVHDWDARMTVDVVEPEGRTHRLRYPGVVTSAFSSLGPRAEWRTRGTTPIALIIRVNAFEDPSAPDRATSYLAVARLTARGVCVTDRIPPTNANANEAARQAADQSASRPCMRDLAEQR
jgi:hypothetical protein